MGIRPDVRNEHLSQYPQEEEWLKPFLSGFDVTWGRRRRSHNTELSVYFMLPHKHIQEEFGFDQELMLVYSPYDTLEARSIQAAEQLLQDDPARGRVERLTFLLVSEMAGANNWIRNYVSLNQETRLIAAFSTQDLIASSSDAWWVRNQLATQFRARDLFDFRLPLEHDTYFFGREAEVLSYRDSILRGENRGLFGLRKTGKTSFLFKVERVATKEGTAAIVYLDCQSPQVRTLRWDELIKDLTHRISGSEKRASSPAQVAKAFESAVADATRNNRLVIVFDEIEYITPLAKQDIHWKSDFTSFWQTIRSCQSRHRGLSFIICGVNPSVTEASQYEGIPNPLFGIVSPQYLRGFLFDDLRRMVRTLGRRMGLHFDQEGMNYLHTRYGGHPLLTRIACSLVNATEANKQSSRPVQVTHALLQAHQSTRDSELAFYCEHVVSELRLFYRDEYEMLEMLACKAITDFAQLASEGTSVAHLREYGLLENSNGVPRIAIPVVENYVAAQAGGAYVIAVANRRDWIASRAHNLMRDMRGLEAKISKNSAPLLFGPTSFPEAERLQQMPVATTETEFELFCNILNRCFVEPIELYGKHVGKLNYFWELKDVYPALFQGLERIKIYRHNCFHLRLTPQVEKRLGELLIEDLEGRPAAQVLDLWWVLQQRLLDKLFLGLQVETAKLP